MAQVKIDGLRELQAALRRADADLPKQLRVTLNAVNQVVIRWAQPRVPRRTGRAAGSLKARASQREAKIAAGGRRAPYYPWLDFGGTAGRGRGVHRPFIREGRFIWAGVKHQQKEINAALEEGLAELIRTAGLTEG